MSNKLEEVMAHYRMVLRDYLLCLSLKTYLKSQQTQTKNVLNGHEHVKIFQEALWRFSVKLFLTTSLNLWKLCYNSKMCFYFRNPITSSSLYFHCDFNLTFKNPLVLLFVTSLFPFHISYFINCFSNFDHSILVYNTGQRNLFI